MEKYLRYLPLGLLSAFAVKSLVVGSHMEDAISIVALAAIAFLNEMHVRHSEKNKLQKQIDDLNARIEDQAKEFNEKIVDAKRGSDEVKKDFAVLKLAANAGRLR